jgi:hypothetical protein
MYNRLASLTRIPSNVDCSYAKINEMVNAIGTPWLKKTEREYMGTAAQRSSQNHPLQKKGIKRRKKIYQGLDVSLS